jgi:peroxiredoxin
MVLEVIVQVMTALRVAASKKRATPVKSVKEQEQDFLFDNRPCNLETWDMPLLTSTMLALGTTAPDFELPDTAGRMVGRDEFRGKSALLVLFICNHCPYVRHVRHELASIGRDYQRRGVGIVAINSNDAQMFPNDSPEKMKTEVTEVGYTFPYLFDETQEVAKAYHAACTPDVFLFNKDFRLVYRGQIDDSRPKTDLPVTGKDLRAALDAVLAGMPVSERQVPSLGCSIKWKSGNEPAS